MMNWKYVEGDSRDLKVLRRTKPGGAEKNNGNRVKLAEL
jgi:hypothetical protein